MHDLHPVSGGYRAAVRVDLDRLVGNHLRLAARHPNSEAAAVVKCDAYGLGLAPCSVALARDASCRSFFVAHPEEGVALRTALASDAPDAEIFVLNGPTPASLAAFFGARLTPVLNSLPQAKAWTGAAPGVAAAVHADLGINRLGVPEADLEAVFALPGLQCTLFMGHMSCAGDPADPANAAELARFGRLRAIAPTARASLVSTGGALLDGEYGFDLVRLGVGLYGVSPFSDPHPDIQPVATLLAEILETQEIAKGARVGYGGLFVADRPTLLATIALGYGDGFPRHAPADGAAAAMAIVAGAPCPIVGRVSMDLITIDATDAPGEVRAGDVVEIFGDRAPIEALADACGTIGYELLTRLSSRVRREYFWRGDRFDPNIGNGPDASAPAG